MNYYTGLAVDRNALLDIIRNRLEENSWSIIEYGSCPDGTGNYVIINYKGYRIVLRSMNNYLSSFSSSTQRSNGIVGRIDLDNSFTPDIYSSFFYTYMKESPTMPMDNISSNIPYWLFIDSSNLVVVIKDNNNNYLHLWLTSINKTSDYTGGILLSGNANQFTDRIGSLWYEAELILKAQEMMPELYSDLEENSRMFYHRTSNISLTTTTGSFSVSCNSGLSSSTTGEVSRLKYGELCKRAYNTLASSAVLLPINMFFDPYKSQPASLYLGYIPKIFWCNMQNLSPQTEITYGHDKYMVFPQGAIGNCGFAYKKL
ncbi:MAG: hypothetical protein ACI3ZR_05890 [bacterium]